MSNSVPKVNTPTLTYYSELNGQFSNTSTRDISATLLYLKPNLTTWYHIVSDTILLLGGLISSEDKTFDVRKVTLT